MTRGGGDTKGGARHMETGDMSDKNKARLLAFGVGCLLAALALSNMHGCGTVTMRYDSSGRHPDARQ